MRSKSATTREQAATEARSDQASEKHQLFFLCTNHFSFAAIKRVKSTNYFCSE